MGNIKLISDHVTVTEQDDTSKPLGTLNSGADLLLKALADYPELSESAQTISTMSGKDNQQAKSSGYNGSVNFMGTPIEIKDGIGDIEGNKIYVSPDGKIVADAAGKILGSVQNGNFTIIDKEHAMALEQQKLAEKRGG